ncbi:Barrierpepsin [Arthrobotrys entomopaga]|nr:Barrierpepsin [Arthrobotrys entomopaga]
MVAILSLCRDGLLLLTFASSFTTGVEALTIYDRAVDYLTTRTGLVKRAATDSVLVRYSILRYAFYVNLQIGSNSDSVNVRLTDQPWLWVGSQKPSNCSASIRSNHLQCVYSDWSGIYWPTISTTFRNVSNAILSLTQSDTSRFARGYYGTDTVRFGSQVLDNVYVGVSDNFTEAPELGIGVYGSDRQTFPGFLQFIYQQNEIKSLSHGLYFDWMERNQSYLNFGAVDTAKYSGNLVTFNATSAANDITTIELLSCAFGAPGSMAELTAVSNLKANVEFSTARISLPDSVVDTIVNRLGAVYDDSWGGYLIDCSMRYSDFVFLFRFRGIDITVSANHYITPAVGILGYRYQFKGKDGCSLQIGPMSSYSVATNLGYQAVLGTPFARHTYLVHDYGNRQLSFAPAIFNTTASNVVPLDSRGVAPLYTVVSDSTPTGNSTNEQPTGGSSMSSPEAIAGGVVGGIAGVSGIALLTWYMMKKRQQGGKNFKPPKMHGTEPTVVGYQGGYSYLAGQDPSKGYQPAVSELGGGDETWPQQQPGRHGTPYVGSQNGYYEGAALVGGYNNQTNGGQSFAHELPTLDQSRR